MPFLDDTRLLDLQSLDATNEKRKPPLGLVDLARDSQNFTGDYIPPSIEAQMQRISSQRNARIPVKITQDPIVLFTPGFNFIPSNLPEYTDYFFVAFDIFSGFRWYPAAYDNNAVDANWDFQQRVDDVLYAMGEAKENLILNVLESRKSQVIDFTTQVSQGDGTYNFDGVTDILEIDKAAQKETMFYNMQQLMGANRLPGNYRLVTNRAGISVQISEAAKYGANNEKNLQALGFLPMDRIYETDGISSADVFDGFFVRDGGIGLIPNFPYDFRQGTVINGKRWSVTPVEMPWTRSRLNVYVNTEATEGTALIAGGAAPTDSNLVMTHFEEMAMWDRFFIPFRFNSDLATRANDIVKVRGLTT